MSSTSSTEDLVAEKDPCAGSKQRQGGGSSEYMNNRVGRFRSCGLHCLSCLDYHDCGLSLYWGRLPFVCGVSLYRSVVIVIQVGVVFICFRSIVIRDPCSTTNTLIHDLYILYIPSVITMGPPDRYLPRPPPPPPRESLPAP